MCTAITYKTKDSYFGRNLDLQYSYNETVTITPRNFKFDFRHMNSIDNHYAIIGMAYVVEDYPLYYDATNEHGLSMAGLYFPKNAKYQKNSEGKENIATFELIPWILCQCVDIEEVKKLLDKINITDEGFSKELQPSPLHWIISDKHKSITIECVEDGMKVYENAVGVLTNNPTFDFHMTNLTNYINLSPYDAPNRFSEKIKLETFSKGMGALGLPGDTSSVSRFVRAAFTKLNSISGESEEESVGQFFHILNSVSLTKGTSRLESGENEITVYSSCCNVDKGIYYYTTYENSTVTAVSMYNEDIDCEKLVSYPIKSILNIKRQN